MNSRFEHMSDQELTAWLQEITRLLKNKRARESAYIASKRNNPATKSRSLKKIAREQEVLAEVIEFLEYMETGGDR